MDEFIYLVIGCAFLGIVILLLGVILFLTIRKMKQIQKRFSTVVDIDKEVEVVTKEKVAIEQQIQDLQIGLEKTKVEIEKDTASLRSEYKNKKLVFDQLVATAAIYNEEIELAELGFYKPHFDFDSSEDYKDKINEIKDTQKSLIKNKVAITCSTEWKLEGSIAKGKKMTDKAIRLTARAFNNECEASISNVRWNNVTRMEQRITKAFEAINKLNESNNIVISSDYLRLKIQELQLAFEYQDKKQKEKEEQAEIRRQMREEAKLEQEVMKAIKEEEKAQKALERAKLEAEQAVGEKLDALMLKIQGMTKELEEAHQKGERAKSMAEQTRSGHVYVISNIGSFGEKVYKIGMTRRLEPMDRVKELGDASVPFIFDVHAMIYSDNAPTLENELHRAFENQRLNMVNSRKEFFRVDLGEIEQKVKRINPEASFIRIPEAREYHESVAIRTQKKEEAVMNDVRKTLPQEI